MTTISGKCQRIQENKCQPLQEKAEKLLTKTRKRHSVCRLINNFARDQFPRCQPFQENDNLFRKGVNHFRKVSTEPGKRVSTTSGKSRKTVNQNQEKTIPRFKNVTCYMLHVTNYVTLFDWREIGRVNTNYIL